MLTTRSVLFPMLLNAHNALCTISNVVGQAYERYDDTMEATLSPGSCDDTQTPTSVTALGIKLVLHSASG